MKRLALILVSALTFFGGYSQVVSTKSEKIEIFKEKKKPRVPIKLEFYAKAGLNIMSTNWQGIDGDPEIPTKSTVGFNVAFGFMSHFRPTKPSDFYWGAELGLSQVGGGFDEFTYHPYSSERERYYPSEKFADFGAYLTPVIGWLKPVSKTVSIDLHFNPGIYFKFKEREVLYISNHRYEETDYVDNHFNLIFKVGAGVWINKFNIDLSYMPIVYPDNYYNSYTNLCFNVGYKF